MTFNPSAYSNFQEAVALLARHGEKLQGQALDDLITKFQLSESQGRHLKLLAEDRMVKKFGKAMRSIRSRMGKNGLQLALPFIPEKFLWELFTEHFEPESTYIKGYRIAYSFADFMVDDEYCQQRLSQACPPFIFDLLRFIAAQSFLRCYDKPALHIPDNSRLNHREFRLLDLEWDIPGYVQALRKGSAPEGPNKQPKKVLMVNTPNKPDYSLFEIDDETFNYLSAELETGAPFELPSSFADLVGLGLVKNPST